VAQPGEVLLSRTVKDLMFGSGHQVREAGTRTLAGVPETWQLFALA
jgi:class 3 adenylate cyclase